MNLEQASCRSPQARLLNWFPFPEDREGIVAAKAVCASCPLKQECLAQHLHEPFGIFGGLTESERRLANRERLWSRSLASELVRDGRR